MQIFNTCEMQNPAAYFTLYVICCIRGGDFVYFHTTHQFFVYILMLKKQSSAESTRFPEIRMTYSGFLFHLQLTWGTPAGKREECSFKGKNLEVRGIFYHSGKIMKIPQQNSSIMTALKAWIFLFSFFPCSPLFSLALWGDKMSIEFCVDKPFHQLQIDSSSVQARQRIALFVCALLLSLSVCLLPCCHASCCIPRRQTLVIFVLQCTTLVCVLQKAHQATAVWCWEVFFPHSVWEKGTFLWF